MMKTAFVARAWLFFSLAVFVANEFKPFPLATILGVPEDHARDAWITFCAILLPIAVIGNERRKGGEQMESKSKTRISKVKVFVVLQAMKFWYVFRKVHESMPWVLYRQRKLEIEAELESEMRSFVAKAFDLHILLEGVKLHWQFEHMFDCAL